MTLKDGMGKKIPFTKRAIRGAIAGMTNYVEYEDPKRLVVMTMDNDYKEYDLDYNDSYYGTYSNREEAIDVFINLCKGVVE